MSSENESLANVARRRIDAMLADPFGQQVLRDLVPQGAQITPADPGRPLSEAIRVAMGDSHGLPAFLAVVNAEGELTILVVEASDEPGQVTIRSPGYRTGGEDVDPGVSLAELVTHLRPLNEEQ